MTDPKLATLAELQILFTKNNIQNEKIKCIKLLRQITGEGLKEAKDFFEQVVQPANQHGGYHAGQAGSAEIVADPMEQLTEELPPPMYLVGMTYLQVSKAPTLIIGVANYNTRWETVYSIGSDGTPVHRYNRRDFGRVTGTQDSPNDLKRLDQ